MNNVAKSVNRHQELRRELLERFPELASDDVTMRDTLDGLSDLKEVIAALIEDALLRESMAKGIGERIDALEARKSRLLTGAQKLRDLALWAMGESDLGKLVEPGFTASIGESKPAVMITDEALIPRKWCKMSWKPDKTAIGQALKEGEEIEGAMLSNARSKLTVRTL